MTGLSVALAVVVGSLTAYSTPGVPVTRTAEYIQIRHAGEEDHPSVTMVVVVDENGLPAPRPLRTHYILVSKALFASVADYVLNARPKYSGSVQGPPKRGTFEVAWQVHADVGRFIVPPLDSCKYLKGLSVRAMQDSKEKGAAQIRRELEVTMGYGSCPTTTEDGNK